MSRPSTRCALVLALGLLTAAAAYGVEVQVDYDPTVDFSVYRTIGWMEGTPAEDPEVENRIHAAIERELIPLGLTEVREDPDLLLVTHASLEAEKLIEIAEHPYWGDYKGWKKTLAVSEESWGAETGMLIVDIIDAASRRLIWRGIATGNRGKTSEQRDRRLDKTMARLFKGFPPRYKPLD